MTTMAQSIKKFVQSREGKVTAEEIKQDINTKHPGQWKPKTLQAHLYACVVNNPKAYIHHSSTEKFLYKHSDGTFELYTEEMHGPNEWAPTEGEDDITEVTTLIETSISLERDIEDHLIHNLESLENGLEFVERQHTTDIGRIDVLAKDLNGNRVVIEIKVGEAKDSAIGQIARYLGWFGKLDDTPTRGMLVAAEFSEGVSYAAQAVPNLSLHKYKVSFAFNKVTV